jgi:hypothetical protein
MKIRLSRQAAQAALAALAALAARTCDAAGQPWRRYDSVGS